MKPHELCLFRIETTSSEEGVFYMLAGCMMEAVDRAQTHCGDDALVISVSHADGELLVEEDDDDDEGDVVEKPRSAPVKLESVSAARQREGLN